MASTLQELNKTQNQLLTLATQTFPSTGSENCELINTPEIKLYYEKLQLIDS